MTRRTLCHDPKWCLFFDFHTMPAVPDVGARFDIPALIRHFRACGVDYVVFPARCNLGMAYYNTKVGIRHPSLKYDLFGRLAHACHQAGVAISAYINVGLSHEEALRHRDWCILREDGRLYGPDPLNSFFRFMCYNTGYGGHVAAMVREVVTNYPVSGLFLDCMCQPPCVGVECVRKMKAKGMDPSDPAERHKFAWLSRLQMARRIAQAARSVKPDLLLYFNGVGYEDQEDIGTYLEFECLPTSGFWGYDSLPAYGRYLRTLGKPVLNMTGRFHKSWGDFGGIRPEASLEYDCLHGLALGLRPTIGDHFHPRGDIHRPVFEMVERIYGRLRRLEPWLDSAVPLSDMAVVLPTPEFAYGLGKAPTPGGKPDDRDTLRGAARVLAELKHQFDVISPRRSWDGYEVLVLPDCIPLDDVLADKVRRHLKKGGRVLSTGWSGLDPSRTRFALGERWGVRYRGEDLREPVYLQVGPELADGVPDMPLDLYAHGVSLAACRGTRRVAEIVPAYFPRHWNSEHGHVYAPPNRPSGQPAITIHGGVVHISHAVFTAYYRSAYVPMRRIVGNILARLLPQPLVRAPDLPSFAKVTVTAQPHRRMLHVLSYVPERRGSSTDVIEEPVELRNVHLALRSDGRRPKRVYLAPARESLAWVLRDGYVEITVPVVAGYAMVVVEESEAKA